MCFGKNSDGGLVGRMKETDATCVQAHLTTCGLGAVERVAQNRRIESTGMCCMDTQLVGASGLRQK